MSPIIAPWLRPTDVLGSISAGTNAGVAIRAAIERERAARAEEEMQAERMAQAEQSAAEKLRYDYQQLGLETALKERDRTDRLEAAKAVNALNRDKFGLDVKQLGETEKYHAGVLENQKERAKESAAAALLKSNKPTPFHIGDAIVEYDPTTRAAKDIYGNSKVPNVSGIPLTEDPQGPKISLPANNPLLNKLLGTNATSLGTNWVKPPQASAAPSPVETEPKKLDATGARAILDKAGGDKKKARELAREAGYVF